VGFVDLRAFVIQTSAARSTTVTADGATGARTAELWYKPWGESRGTLFGVTPTTYCFTGQTLDSVAGGLYFYNARYYDPALGRFTQADTIVPEPGNPQSLNRYTYVGNRPLGFVDPSGYAACAAGDMACWQNEWRWKDRWYKAHGWFNNGNGWTTPGMAVFEDVGILSEMAGEAGISFASGWDWNTQKAQMTAIGQGIALFGQKLSGGLARLRELLGGGAIFHHVVQTPLLCLSAPACALPPGSNHVYFSNRLLQEPVEWIRMTTVHELAHVIDWHSRIQTGIGSVYGLTYPTFGRFSDAWHGAPLTNYAACGGLSCVNHWERWAEAVTVWVFGNGYKSSERPLNVDVGAQMTRIEQLLNGWR